MYNMRRRLSGFTLIELMVVIIIISVLAVLALPRFADTGSQAQKVATQAMAGSLASAVVMVRGQWLVTGGGGPRENLPGFGRGDVDVTADGWPADVAGSTDSTLTAARCLALWHALLAGVPPSVGTGSGIGSSDYEVQAVPDRQALGADCLYIYRLAPSNRIRYDADRGEVSLESNDAP